MKLKRLKKTLCIISLALSLSIPTMVYAASYSTTFGVTLYKKGFIFSTEIGSFKANRAGKTSNGWTNMDAGNYFIYLSKANDGARVEGSIKISQ